MRDSVVYTELNDLWVDHDKLHVLGVRLIEDTHNNRVDADGFTGTCRTCDQKMGHLRDIRDRDLSCNILPDAKRDPGSVCLKLLGFHQFPERYHHILLVRDLDADRCFSRNRRFDTDIRRRQIELNVVRQIYDLADLHAHFRLNLITSDRRTAAYIRNRNIHAEVLQSLLQLRRRLLQMCSRISCFCCSLCQ